MRTHQMLFSRRYRAALLDYLLVGGEPELARAYDLGRMAINENVGLLAVLLTHQHAVGAILEAASHPDRDLRRLERTQAFFMEALSVFEMTHRGYLAMLDEGPANPREDAPRRRAHRTR